MHVHLMHNSCPAQPYSQIALVREKDARFVVWIFRTFLERFQTIRFCSARALARVSSSSSSFIVAQISTTGLPYQLRGNSYARTIIAAQRRSRTPQPNTAADVLLSRVPFQLASDTAALAYY